jgi:hypothetical protein
LFRSGELPTLNVDAPLRFSKPVVSMHFFAGANIFGNISIAQE